MSLSNFNIIAELSSGNSIKVYKAIKKSDGQLYAIKKIFLGSLTHKDKENALNEVRILASFNHPNIIKYKETFIEPINYLCIVMEIAKQGNLGEKIKEKEISKNYFEEEYIWQALIQVTQGLKVLHKAHILHRDIKSENIFISEDGIFKIGDFDVSKVIRNRVAYSYTGTPYFNSPEIWNDKPYSYSADIWALGCVIYHMTTLSLPFTETEKLKEKVIKGKFKKIPNFYTEELSEIINKMLKLSPEDRPTCEEILEFCWNRKQTNYPSFNLLGTIELASHLSRLQDNLPEGKYNLINEPKPKIQEVFPKDCSLIIIGSIESPIIVTYSPKDSNYLRVDGRTKLPVLKQKENQIFLSNDKKQIPENFKKTTRENNILPYFNKSIPQNKQQNNYRLKNN